MKFYTKTNFNIQMENKIMENFSDVFINIKWIILGLWRNEIHICTNIFYLNIWRYQWRNRLAFKADRWEVPGSIPGRACRPRCLKFSVVFSEIRINTS